MNNGAEQLYPEDDGQLLAQNDSQQIALANDDIINLVGEIRQIKHDKQDADKRYKRAQQKLDTYMREREILINPQTGECLLTWKYTADRAYFNEKQFKEEHGDVWNEYVQMKPGYKVLLLKGEGND